MVRFIFTITVCVGWLLLEVIYWKLGFGFNYHFLISSAIVTPFCAIFMPDRKYDTDRHVSAMSEAAQARIAELERDNAILRAKVTGAVYVYPECDIAECKHYRAALEDKG